MTISKQTIDEIREKTDIVSVISEYVDLEKKGNNYLGLCPFHNEKTPSFNVNPEKDFYHCFGCKAHGSMIDFVMEMDNLDFQQAVYKLGQKIGVNVEVSKSEMNSKDMQLISMHNIMVELYHQILVQTTEGESALNYMLDRGFTLEDIKKEKIGLSPNMNDFAIKALSEKGYSNEAMFQAGILSRNEETFSYFDRFRNRIMIPIKNHKGNFVGFTSRSTDGSKPKYLNTPETDLFQKRRLFYNLFDAFKMIRTKNEIFLMEGHMDVLKVKTTKVKNIVGLMGTSLSNEQVEILRRSCENVTLMFDGDTAGHAATKSIGENLLKSGLNVYVIPLGEGQDPDELIVEKGVEAFEKYVYENKISFLLYIAQKSIKEAKGNDLLYTERLTELIELLKYINDDIQQNRLVSEIAELFEVDQGVIYRRLPNKRQLVKRINPSVMRNITETSPRDFKEKLLLKTFINKKEYLDRFIKDYELEIFNSMINYGIFNKLVEYYSTEEDLDISRLYSYLDDDQITIIEQLMNNNLPIIDSISQLDDYINDLSGIKNSMKDREKLQKEIEEAELLGDINRQLELLQLLIELDQSHKL
ncbi:DNA primase [Phocicoccus pinnipedialis]|uniref:DNA primase n=1 Tax=Phocicoccus pinnipedialis TaxID=110845 RepID=A0A6V7RE30_9BACL|nr:DNA primase [Jeotgalicoccus pinnipedialis]MBP1939276.1 DNA primase [Jeotgalicoccus pinnipedialis]CAD2076061.1 DNA primase [Jeotgalicoccus pinnipedialis]